MNKEEKDKDVEKLTDWYHERLHDYVGHPQALREVIKKAIELGKKLPLKL